MEKSDLQSVVEDAIASVFEKRDLKSDLTRDTHAEHHAWLGQRIAKEAARAEFWHNIQVKTVPWAVVALMGWAGTSVWSILGEWAKGHWK